MVKIIILLISLLIATNNVLSDYKFKVIDESNFYKLRVYIFLTYPTCYGCETNCDFIVKSFENIKNVELVGFISGINEEGILALKEKYNWTFKIIPDAIGLYHKYYKVDTTNSFLILDNEGKILFKKNLSTDINNIKFVQGLTNNIKLKSHDSELELSEEIKINLENKYSDIFYRCLFSQKYNQYYFIGNRNGVLITSDSSGKIIRIDDSIVEQNVMRNFSVLNYSWRIVDSIILISAGFFDTKKGWSNRIIEYDIVRSVFSIINHNIIDTIKSSFSFYGCPINGNYLAIFKYQSEYSNDSNNKVKPISVYGTDLKHLGDFGYIPDIYNKFNLKKMYLMLFANSNEFLFSIQMFSNYINVYDKNYKISDTIELEKSPNLRMTKKNIPLNPGKYDWGEFLSSASIYRTLLYNKDEDLICLFFSNVTFPPNVVDPSSPEVIRESYIAIYNMKGNLIRELKFTEKMFEPILFINNSITICCFENNSILIKKYKFRLKYSN